MCLLDTNLLEILATFGLCSMKYLAGLTLSFVTDIGFIPSVLVSIAGGMAGVWLFAFGGKAIVGLLRRLKLISQKKDVTRISKSKRWLVGIRRRFGLLGIALLTPILLQVPIGTLIAMRFNNNVGVVSLYMFGSFAFYSLLLSGLYYGLNINIQDVVASWF